MKDLGRLDRVRSGSFWFRHEGELHETLSPDQVRWDVLADCLESQEIPDRPRMPHWKSAALFARWSAHFDLPSYSSARRLAYLLERYYDQIEVDLRHRYAGVSVSELWTSRQWRLLLNMIDHLPRNTHYSEAVSKDPEHGEQLAKAMAENGAGAEASQAKPKPPLHTWSDEVGMLAEVVDAVKSLNHITILANSGGKGKSKAPEPFPRPDPGAFEAAKKKMHATHRQARHEALTRRLLPHKR